MYLPIRLPYFNNEESKNAIDEAIEEHVVLNQEGVQMHIEPPTLNDIDDIDGLPEAVGKRRSSLAKNSSIKSIKQKE